MLGEAEAQGLLAGEAAALGAGDGVRAAEGVCDGEPLGEGGAVALGMPEAEPSAVALVTLPSERQPKSSTSRRARNRGVTGAIFTTLYCADVQAARER